MPTISIAPQRDAWVARANRGVDVWRDTAGTGRGRLRSPVTCDGLHNDACCTAIGKPVVGTSVGGWADRRRCALAQRPRLGPGGRRTDPVKQPSFQRSPSVVAAQKGTWTPGNRSVGGLASTNAPAEGLVAEPQGEEQPSAGRSSSKKPVLASDPKVRPTGACDRQDAAHLIQKHCREGLARAVLAGPGHGGVFDTIYRLTKDREPQAGGTRVSRAISHFAAGASRAHVRWPAPGRSLDPDCPRTRGHGDIRLSPVLDTCTSS